MSYLIKRLLGDEEDRYCSLEDLEFVLSFAVAAEPNIGGMLEYQVQRGKSLEQSEIILNERRKERKPA